MTTNKQDPKLTIVISTYVNSSWTKLYLPVFKTQSVPRSKHYPSRCEASQLMLYRKIIALCSEIHTKHVNTLCGQNVGVLNAEPGGTYSDYWATKG